MEFILSNLNRIVILRTKPIRIHRKNAHKYLYKFIKINLARCTNIILLNHFPYISRVHVLPNRPQHVPQLRHVDRAAAILVILVKELAVPSHVLVTHKRQNLHLPRRRRLLHKIGQRRRLRSRKPRNLRKPRQRRLLRINTIRIRIQYQVIGSYRTRRLRTTPIIVIQIIISVQRRA